MQVGQNTQANAYAINVGKAEDNTSKTLQRIAAARALSSDNAANSAISDALQLQSDTFLQGVKNANDAIGVLNIAGGSASQLSQSADNLNTLSVAYNNGALGQSEQEALKQEASGIIQSMQQITDSSSFNGKNVFSDFTFQTGSSTTSFSLGLPSLSALDITNQKTISDFASGIEKLQANIGASTNAVTSTVDALMQNIVNTQSASSQLTDTDMAKAASDNSQNQLKANAALFAQAHSYDYLKQKVNALLG